MAGKSRRTITKKPQYNYTSNDHGTIELSKGYYSIVDSEDVEWLMQWKWSYLSAGYAVRGGSVDYRKFSILMHRAILDAPPNMYVDHINGDKLDNRRVNLRIVTPRQSAWNISAKSNCASPYKGVMVNGDAPWIARIKAQNRLFDLGSFDTEEEAARAYDAAAKKYFGEYARLNFTEDDTHV